MASPPGSHTPSPNQQFRAPFPTSPPSGRHVLPVRASQQIEGLIKQLGSLKNDLFDEKSETDQLEQEARLATAKAEATEKVLEEGDNKAATLLERLQERLKALSDE